MDTIRFIVTRGKDNPTLIPNAFSPNNDTRNEVWRPYLYSFEKLVKMQIYNRWGEKLYEGSEGWDGYYMGKPVQMGAYLYMIEIEEALAYGKIKRNYHSGTEHQKRELR